MGLDKRFLLTQLRQHCAEILAVAQRAEIDAREAARNMATESEKKEDGRVALEFGGLAAGQAVRLAQARRELEALDSLLASSLPSFGAGAAVSLGAIVDVAIDDLEDHHEERTFFLLPTGAGVELTGPGGDGYLQVMTPGSPAGRALMGRHAGEVIDVRLGGTPKEWTILEVS
jgi:transcription elongation GreA/GreB family factor